MSTHFSEQRLTRHSSNMCIDLRSMKPVDQLVKLKVVAMTFGGG